MNFHDSLPLMIYDDKCYVCIKFAKLMNFLAKGKLRMIGHYTEFGGTIREEILEDDALEMFWFIDKKTAYGGRAAILPLIKLILCKTNSKVSNLKINDECKQECKTIKALMKRTFSLFSNSKIIKIHRQKQ